MPASTVCCCGWRCLSCCRRSRFVLSLASVGNVCWAKPNHGFFNCQQPDAKKFSQPADAVRDRDRCARTMPRSRCMRGMTPETAASRKTSGKHMFHRRRANAIAHVAHVVRSQATACGRMPGTNQGMRNEATRTSRFARRTSRFARKCANFFCARHPWQAPFRTTLTRCRRNARGVFLPAPRVAHGLRACVAKRRKRRTRDVAAAGSDASTRVARMRQWSSSSSNSE